ncbi:protein SEED AND ROOT HAIR PROTECTIVE PROTEIN-like [Juglans microcarpa x Juglans regia]|uniref:protein SEED AND ROOT HAIR PROTECTIVE PROTEIN-like n=1 Tax=Juglans microcarpa x Juglans regia TaxID=2249226 RepID=UPI001B7F4B7E|nr:protein SEED AND ROOT HAIR PROTECTIVE PROTEIN-like [Juglans microcarpa x Juglans regia]
MADLNLVLFPASLLLVMISSLVLVINASASGEGYSPKYDVEKTNVGKDGLLSTIIAIQGLVYCKSDSNNLIPLEGAVTRITCLAVDERGFETAPFTFLSNACNPKGYFFATLSPAEVQDGRKLKECRAFLELSPSDACNFPTDVNKGIAGALLGSFRLLEDKKMKLYTVGPFFFTPEPNSNSDGF